MERRRRSAGLMAAVGVLISLVVACAPPAPAPTPAAPSPAAEPIKIAALTSLSGPFAAWGVKVRDGMKFAAEELNKGGGVEGREVVILERDTKNNPDEAMTALRGLVEREGVAAAGGVVSSGVGLAASRVAEELKVPLFLSFSGSHRILNKSSRFTFRTMLVAAPMTVDPIAAFIKERGYKRVGSFIADYEWGHAFQDSAEKLIKPLPGVTLQTEVAPVGETDFTPYLRKLQRLNPELVLVIGHPPGSFSIIKQALELGVGQYFPGPWSSPDMYVERVGEGVFGRLVEFGATDFADSRYQELAARFYQGYKTIFENASFSGYVTVKIVADAVKKSGSLAPQGIAKAVREGKFVQPGYAYPLSYTEWGELKEATPIVYTIEAGDPGPINPGANWRPKVLLRSPLIQPYVPTE